MRTGLLLAALLAVCVACGEADPGATTTTTGSQPTSSAAETTTSTSGAPGTSVRPETTTTGSPIDVAITGGVASGATTFSYDIGDLVDITVVSDVDDELHVHGYDLLFDLTAGVPFTLEFVADIPGVFEVEIHTGHTHVFDIEVVG